MADWQVGDLALCTDGRPCRCDTCNGAGPPFVIPAGAVHRVSEIVFDETGLGLVFEDIDFVYGHSDIFDPARFRKIRPDAHEPCEAEFVTLIKRIKQPSKVGA